MRTKDYKVKWPVIELRDSYGVVFDNSRMADYWFREFCTRFYMEIQWIRKFERKVQLKDSSWTFLSSIDLNKLKGHRFNYIYSGDAIYIILDDPERLRVLEGEENRTC